MIATAPAKVGRTPSHHDAEEVTVAGAMAKEGGAE